MFLATVRDLREFLAAKRRKREPVMFHAIAVVQASARPRDARAFRALRMALRQNRDFERASERLDALEREVVRRGAPELPLPAEVVQNSDRSLSLFWPGGVSVRCFPEGIAFLIGGTAGRPGRGIQRELLEALALRSRIMQA